MLFNQIDAVSREKDDALAQLKVVAEKNKILEEKCKTLENSN